MEGISYEAISLAGHLGLSKLVVLWDNNSISIDGNTNLSTSEDMKMRFKSCNWKVIEIDGHDFDQIRKALKQAQKSDKPVMISCKTTIAYGSPNKCGSEKSHGSPLGTEEIVATRKNLGWNHEPFVIPENILEAWKKAVSKGVRLENKWKKLLNNFVHKDEFLNSQKKRN
jgi:transketolase